MTKFEKRLNALKNRRQGIEEIATLRLRLSAESEAMAIASSLDPESEAYEKLREAPSIKYAIGAMAPVGQKYTETSINEGNRVANVVTSGLHGLECVMAKMQGSVALDIHIKGFSDVDMLIICNNPISTQEPLIKPEEYSASNDPRRVPQIINDIGNHSERVLKAKFHTATVTRGKKSIAIEGGPLTRKVDIVPSMWYDSHSYQKTKIEFERGIQILDTSTYELFSNFPFLHIQRINSRDYLFDGNLKSLIRLIKNITCDLPEQKYKQAKRLTSYDVAAICYHMDNNLFVQHDLRLGLIEKLRKHLDHILKDDAYRSSLNVPDDTRKIFDSPEKYTALEIIKEEIADLATSIGMEINSARSTYTPSDILNKRVYL